MIPYYDNLISVNNLNPSSNLARISEQPPFINPPPFSLFLSPPLASLSLCCAGPTRLLPSFLEKEANKAPPSFSLSWFRISPLDLLLSRHPRAHDDFGCTAVRGFSDALTGLLSVPFRV